MAVRNQCLFSPCNVANSIPLRHNTAKGDESVVNTSKSNRCHSRWMNGFPVVEAMAMSSQSPEEHDDRVVQLIANSQHGLFLYICGLLFRGNLAEDMLQETNLVLWEKRGEYRSDSNFYAWACQIAYYKVCEARREQRRKVPAFSDLFLQQLAPPLQAMTEAHWPGTGLPGGVPWHPCRSRPRFVGASLRRWRHDKVHRRRLGAKRPHGQSVASRIHEALFDCIEAKSVEETRS